ncbi:unnamed protein product, partial [Brenthis ino]
MTDSKAPTPSDDHIPQVSHIALKLPPFWSGRVVAWFAQAEANFEISECFLDRTFPRLTRAPDSVSTKPTAAPAATPQPAPSPLPAAPIRTRSGRRVRFKQVLDL